MFENSKQTFPLDAIFGCSDIRYVIKQKGNEMEKLLEKNRRDYRQDIALLLATVRASICPPSQQEVEEAKSCLYQHLQTCNAAGLEYAKKTYVIEEG